MEKHFVTFYSPGTFFSEDSTLDIDSWDVDKAVIMSKEITERFGSKPYGFKFITKGREADELDSKIIATSNMYYLGGTIMTLAEVKAQNNHDDKILITNMECNGWDRIIVNTNSWKHTAPLKDDDVVLDMDKE